MAKKSWRRRSKLFASFVITTLGTNQETFVTCHHISNESVKLDFRQLHPLQHSNNSKSDTSVSTLLLPRQRLLLANYVKKTCKTLLHVNPNSVTSPPRLGQSLAFELINTVFQYCTRNIQGLQYYIAARRRHIQFYYTSIAF